MVSVPRSAKVSHGEGIKYGKTALLHDEVLFFFNALVWAGDGHRFSLWRKKDKVTHA